MAIYTGRYSTAGRGKLGGIVLHGNSAVNLMRSRAIPVSNPTRGQVKQLAQIAQNPQTWLGQYAAHTFGWMADASWITYGDGPDFGLEVDPTPMFTAAQSNAALLGTVAFPTTDGFPSLNPAIDSLILTGIGAGEGIVTAYTGGEGYSDPWLLYLTAIYQQPTNTPPNTGGTFIGGSLTEAAVNVQSALAGYLGQAPTTGQCFALRAVTTYETDLITGTSYAFIITPTS